VRQRGLVAALSEIFPPPSTLAVFSFVAGVLFSAKILGTRGAQAVYYRRKIYFVSAGTVRAGAFRLKIFVVDLLIGRLFFWPQSIGTAERGQASSPAF
jgi:hypothetical protein